MLWWYQKMDIHLQCVHKMQNNEQMLRWKILID